MIEPRPRNFLLARLLGCRANRFVRRTRQNSSANSFLFVTGGIVFGKFKRSLRPHWRGKMNDPPNLQPCEAEIFVVRKRRCPAYEIVEERFARRLRRLRANRFEIFAIAIRLSGLAELLVHRAHHVVETARIVRPLANPKIEQHANHRAFRVVRNAMIRLIVNRIFLEPRIEARLLRALPFVRGTRFQLRDFLPKIRVEMRLRPDPGSQQRVLLVGARRALVEPQGFRVLLLRVVHGFKRRGSNSLHIPQMKKLMRRNREQSFFRARRNRGPIRVLHASPPDVVPNMKNKRVLRIWRSTHQRNFITTDLRKLCLDLIAMWERGMNYDGDILDTWQREPIEVSNFKRSMGEGIVGHRVNKPRRRALPAGGNIVEGQFQFFAAAGGSEYRVPEGE